MRRGWRDGVRVGKSDGVRVGRRHEVGKEVLWGWRKGLKVTAGTR